MGYRRSQQRDKRLKKLYKSCHGYIYPVYYDEKKKRIVQYNKTKYWKYLKKQSSKRVRRYQLELSNSDYKKIFDIKYNYW